MVETNQGRLVEQSVTGEITHPLKGRSPYVISAEGEPRVLPGVGGITFNARVGDSAVDWEADHVEPGASFSNMSDKGGRRAKHNFAFNVMSCVGNRAKLLDWDGGEDDEEEDNPVGTVIGTHGGIEHVMIDFPWDVLEELTVGDQVQVKAKGVGLELVEYKSIKALNCSPRLLDAMDIEEGDDGMRIPVTHRVPARIMGSGLGADNTNRGDYDIQMFDEEIVEEYGLDSLRFGDVVAIEDADHTYGRIYRSGAITIGVVVHSRSVISGHGPGVTTLMTSSEGDIEPVQSDEANLANILDLREDWG
ncbi:MAG: DUF4438 domain-containing protein [bacterium]